MGRANLRAVLDDSRCELIGGVDRRENAEDHHDLGILAGLEPTGIRVSDDAPAVLANANVAIEFSTPEATLQHSELCATVGCAQVIGTTGFTTAQETLLKSFASRIPIMWAPNMSLGVNILLSLVEQVASRLGETFDIEIAEVHHRLKVDAPSGTALALGRAAAKGRQASFDDVADFARHGIVGPRAPGSIGFAVSRGGDNVGEHEVTFAGEGERIVMGHVATDRKIYANGALHAAHWLSGRKPGMYSMIDVLNL